MLEVKLRAAADRVLAPIGRGLARAGVTPNSVTILGVIVQAVGGWLILQDRLVAAGLVTIAAAVLDTFDGAVAKAGGRTTPFGALLDSTVDRVSDALFFIPVAWLYGFGTDGRDEPWVAAVALGGLVASFLVSYVRARAEGLGFDCRGGIAGRAERSILMIVGLVFDLLSPVVAILAGLSTVTVLQRLAHVRAQARALHDAR